MSRRKDIEKLQFSALERMQLFVKRAQDLIDEPIWKSGGLSVRVNMPPSKKILEEPDASYLNSYLLIFRPFILNDEPIYFHSVRGIAHRHLRSEKKKELAHHLKRYKEMWKHAMKEGRFDVSVNETTLSPEKVLDAHLYGYFFHYKRTNVEELKQFEGLPVRIDKIRLYDTLADLTEVIFQLGNFIAYGLKNDHFDISELQGF